MLPAAATGLWAFLLCVLLVKYFVRPFKSDALPCLTGDAPPKRRAPVAEPLSRALTYGTAAFVLSRLILAALLLAGAAAFGQFLDFTQNPLNALVRWDANHYLSLARDWYVNEGDARLHLVFFPFYPLILRGLYLMGLNVEIAGIAVSNACLWGAGVCLYRLVRAEKTEREARLALWFLMLNPMTIIDSLPFGESLFLLLTLLCVLMARKRRFALALLFGALSSATRLLGLLCAVPIFYSYLLMVREKKGGARMALVCALKTCLVAAGFGAYLWLNKNVSGDPFRFLLYQREHWSQSFGSLYNTLSYTLKNALNYGDFHLQLGTWVPQALYILLTLVLLALAYRHADAGDGAYLLLYLYAAAAPTWLLSGARYLSAAYAIYPMLAVLCKNKAVRAVLLTLSALGMAYIAILYTFIGSVM